VISRGFYRSDGFQRVALTWNNLYSSTVEKICMREGRRILRSEAPGNLFSLGRRSLLLRFRRREDESLRDEDENRINHIMEK